MKNIAKNFDSTAMIQATESDARSRFPGAEVTKSDGYINVKIDMLVHPFGCSAMGCQGVLTFPELAPPSLNKERPLWPFTKEDMLVRYYGSEDSDRIGACVLSERHGSFGIVPCSYHFGDKSELHIEIKYDPAEADAVVVYSESFRVMSYAATHKRLAFKLGDTGLYGVVIPFNYLVDMTNTFKGRYESEYNLRRAMARHLEDHLTRFRPRSVAV